MCNKTLLKLQIITAAKLKKSSSFSQFFSNLVTCEKKQIDIWYNLLTEYFCCCNFVHLLCLWKKNWLFRIKDIRSRIDVWVIGANWTSPSYKINIPQFWLEVWAKDYSETAWSWEFIIEVEAVKNYLNAITVEQPCFMKCL